MAIRKFCLMTEGRSGSTSLMEALEQFKDIALPNKNIKCPDNELVHPRDVDKYQKQYSKLCKQQIKTSNELIEAFFELNNTAPYHYAGFKSMPNRHPDYAEFTTRRDIQFITLKRRDIASTAASFITAMSKGSWRRHGEDSQHSWRFDPGLHGDSLRNNLAYIHDSHQKMDSIPGAISLYYEDLCDPGYQCAEMNDYFMRPIAIHDPKPPTSASGYIINWEEYNSFVQDYWHGLAGVIIKRSNDTAEDSVTANPPGSSQDSSRQEKQLASTGPAEIDSSSLNLFCQFIGYPRSGSTLIMALLNAHPDIVIGHEVDAWRDIKHPFDAKPIIKSLLDSVTVFVDNGCRQGNSTCQVPGQWQGRYRSLKVAGSDAAASASLQFRQHPEDVMSIQQGLGVPLRFIHVYRNPFDALAVLKQSGIATMKQASTLYFSMAEGVQAVREAAGNEAVFNLCIEEFINDPVTGLRELCGFLNVECSEAYLQDCRRAVLKPLPQSRKQLAWKTNQIISVRKHIQQFPFFQRYINDSDVPRAEPQTPDQPVNKEVMADILPAARPQVSSAVAGIVSTRVNKQAGRVVYAWELGMDLGHIMRFLPLALGLRKRGHEVVFAIKDLQHAESVIGNQGFQVLQAPIWQQLPKNLKNPPLNYAEIILRYGFLTPSGLKGLVKAWRNLFEYAGATVVIADHAPSALLAAHTMDLKRITIGHGFFSPPAVSPTPNMRPWLTTIPAKRLESSDAIALNNSNSVIADLGGRPIKMLSDLFRVDAEFLCTFRELDHYPGRKGARYWGPGFNIDEGVEVPWPQGKGRKIFAYIKPTHRDFDLLLTTLKEKTDVSVLAYIPGITPKLAEKYQTSRLVISHQPVKLKSIRHQCDLAICHAGIGTVSAVLLAGKPVLLLPTQLEQYLLSCRIEQMGAGLVINTDKKDEKPDYKTLLNRLLKGPSFQQAAQAFAKKYEKFQPDAQYQAMATVVEKLLST